MIFLIAINLFFTVTILLNIWNSFGDLFWSEKWNILGLVAANYIMNVVLVIAFLRQKKIKDESEAYKMYGKYLEDVGLQLRSRQHEYMNQMHTMIGLAQTLPAEECAKAITEYGQIIIQDNEIKKKQFDICSDAIITAVVYGKEKQAEEQKVQFQHVIQEPLEDMRIPAHDLAEILNNLLNNAFEAVSELPYEEREVLLEISPNKIEVLNRLPSDFNEGLPSQIERVGYSTKGQNRGYGVSNVINIVKRYNGSFNIFKQNDMFIFEILLQ
ncbi:sensor histidine kinase [Clostridium aminobutyricum]|uniref:GHKL domain-containing protein n=1 Tax=Clostridium aminobutyricum TaxID=33953 RepID=A0A939DAR1_CLOAM|nr:GHKL domain-containing protein [Clostridium aminobutyricum]MBN7774376.1 GHKL domain-containing protein [Clostridium aminobutyricum]